MLKIHYIKKNGILNNLLISITALITILFLLPKLAFATTINSNITTENITIDGTATLGNATSTDKLYLNVRLGSSIIPTTNNIIDLGEYDRAWNDIFASGTAYLGSATTTQITPWANNTSDLGAYGNAWNDIFASGTAYLGPAEFAGGLTPSSDNLYALGGYGTAWADVFASGTVFVSSTLTGNGAVGSPAYSFAQDTDTGFYLADIGGPLAITIDGTARFAFDTTTLSPVANDSYDLGIFYNGTYGAWRNVYASGTVYASSTYTLAGTAGAPTYTFENDSDSGFYSVNGGAVGLSADGTLRLVFGLTAGSNQGAFPATNNTQDLGQFTDLFGIGAWRNVVASGTIYGDDIVLHDPLASSTIYAKSAVAGLGGELILEDSDGDGCSVISVNDGTLTAAVVTCPSD